MGIEAGRMCDRCPRRQAAFTLIEVLVVIAIIALLASILLPSLSKAREHARSAACRSNIGQICKAEQEYEGQNDGWFPGSPLTTGYFFTISGKPWNPSMTHIEVIPQPPPPRVIRHPFNRFVLEWFDFSTPLRTFMQDPDSIPRAPKNCTIQTAKPAQQAMWLMATDGPFHCPSNPHMARPWQDNSILSDWPVLRATSYLTMSTIMRGGPTVYDHAQQLYKRSDAQLSYQIAQSRTWDLVPPDDYEPRSNRVGRQVSRKVFIADGLRFYGDPEEPFTMNVGTNDTLGAMTGTPPCTFWPHGREYNLARTYSYRHGEGRRINAGFFDGHVESLAIDEIIGEEKSSEPRFVGNAVNPLYYYPSGTVVQNPAALHVNNIAAGTRLP